MKKSDGDKTFLPYRSVDKSSVKSDVKFAWLRKFLPMNFLPITYPILGRAIITEHLLKGEKRLCIVNVYCPMAMVDNEERYLFKMKFYQLLELRCRQLEKAGKYVFFLLIR